MSENQVILSLAGYNQIKAENQKFRMFAERMWDNTTLSKDKGSIEFDTQLLSDIMRLIYPEQYKKRLSYLRCLDTKKEAMRKAQAMQEVKADG